MGLSENPGVWSVQQEFPEKLIQGKNKIRLDYHKGSQLFILARMLYSNNHSETVR